MKCGGVGPPPGYATTDDTAVFDFDAGTPWSTSGAMTEGRVNANLTVLPDGMVLLTGGNEEGTYTDPLYEARIWNPANGTWYDADSNSMADPRWYHSTALLLPDARVFVAGGDKTGVYTAHTGQIFTPGYLNSSPTRAVITTAASEATYGSSYAVAYTHASSALITKACLIKLGSVTHSYNQEQRYVPLTVPSHSYGSATFTMPANANIAPPGYTCSSS